MSTVEFDRTHKMKEAKQNIKCRCAVAQNLVAHDKLWNMSPLADLISRRGFDRFQVGLESRFKAYGIKYVLTYCQPSDNPAMRLDFESPLHIGLVTVWESGLCDLEVIDVSTEQTVFYQHYELSSEAEFHQTYPDLVVFMRDAMG